MGTWFNLLTSGNPMRCFACAPYYPYRIHGDKNPKFDRHSGFILTSKSTQESNYGVAVRYFSEQLLSQTLSWSLEKLMPPGVDLRMLDGSVMADVMVVPSSKANKVSVGLIDVMGKVCSKDRRLSLHADALVRTREVEKLAKGGSRDLGVHMGSIAFRPRRDSSNLIFLVDDVCTSGNSLIACRDIILRTLPGVSVIGIVLGKTAYD